MPPDPPRTCELTHSYMAVSPPLYFVNDFAPPPPLKQFLNEDLISVYLASYPLGPPPMEPIALPCLSVSPPIILAKIKP